MLIISKKKFEFGVKPNTFVTAGAGAIESAPDWVAKEDFFRLAVAEGSIVVLKDEMAAAHPIAEPIAPETMAAAEVLAADEPPKKTVKRRKQR